MPIFRPLPNLDSNGSTWVYGFGGFDDDGWFPFFKDQVARALFWPRPASPHNFHQYRFSVVTDSVVCCWLDEDPDFALYVEIRDEQSQKLVYRSFGQANETFATQISPGRYLLWVCCDNGVATRPDGKVGYDLKLYGYPVIDPARPITSQSTPEDLGVLNAPKVISDAFYKRYDRQAPLFQPNQQLLDVDFAARYLSFRTVTSGMLRYRFIYADSRFINYIYLEITPDGAPFPVTDRPLNNVDQTLRLPKGVHAFSISVQPPMIGAFSEYYFPFGVVLQWGADPLMTDQS